VKYVLIYEYAEAESFVDGDPFVLNGVVRRWEIREWNEILAPDG
jgi:uncharacterized protein YciI